MLCTFWDVASLKCLKLLLMVDLKESKWKWRSSTSSSKLWYFRKIFQICACLLAYFSRNFRECVVFTSNVCLSANCLFIKNTSFDDLGIGSVCTVFSYIVKLVEWDVVCLPESFQNINNIRGKMFLGQL